MPLLRRLACLFWSATPTLSRVLVLVLGRRATAEGRRGFQPTVGHPARPSRRGATIEPSPHDQRSISFAPMPPAFNRRSATNHSCVIAIRGLKPTATIKCRSATSAFAPPEQISCCGRVLDVAIRQRGKGASSATTWHSYVSPGHRPGSRSESPRGSPNGAALIIVRHRR